MSRVFDRLLVGETRGQMKHKIRICKFLVDKHHIENAADYDFKIAMLRQIVTATAAEIVDHDDLHSRLQQLSAQSMFWKHASETGT